MVMTAAIPKFSLLHRNKYRHILSGDALTAAVPEVQTSMAESVNVYLF
jgi:hypothetical protein